MRKQFVALTVAGTALAGMLAAPSAHAVDDPVVVTVTVPAGGVTIDAGADATLSAATTGATTSVGGTLSQISVADTRNLTVGWITSATVGEFAKSGGGTIPGAAGTVTVATADATSGLAATGGFVGTSTAAGIGPIATAVALGNNSATFTPTMSVLIPVGTAAGDYVGTVTFTVT